MYKFKFLRACGVLCALMAFFAWLPLSAQNPGTASDPLVSKSYVDHFLRFRSVVLKAETRIKAEPGALIIVRSGKVMLESAKDKTAINLTTGKEIKVGTELPLNNLIIIPDSGEYYLNARNLSLLMASCLHEENLN